MKCFACDSKRFLAKSDVERIQYKIERLLVPMSFTVCEGCGYEFVATEQILANDRAVLAAKRNHDGLLTPAEIRAAREALGLTQLQAANIFGGGKNAFSKYERGEVTQSEAMDKLIRLCVKHPKLLGELKADKIPGAVS